SFLQDPGTYVYTSDTRARQLFRSTAFHSTVEVDGAEQNTTPTDAPFFNGDEARPRLLSFDIGAARDTASAEHHGYERLAAAPVTHRRAAVFDKPRRFWLIEDTLEGSGTHDFRFVFHAAPGREVRARGSSVEISDTASGASLVVVSLDGLGGVVVEGRWSSREYGAKEESAAAVWKIKAAAPLKARWLLLPVCAGEDAAARLELAVGSC
ncbi:MAG TPA: heparinase II/III family protein, partial [Pyrinomonadaceae bacterium]|nr:heparinase II/III family protein [Pyrinomonadaceae bacterium]